MTDRFKHRSNSEAVAYKNGYTRAREASRLLAFGFFFLGMGVGVALAKWWGL